MVAKRGRGRGRKGTHDKKPEKRKLLKKEKRFLACVKMQTNTMMVVSRTIYNPLKIKLLDVQYVQCNCDPMCL